MDIEKIARETMGYIGLEPHFKAQLEAFAAAIRRDALLEATRECNEYGDVGRCIDAIRALAGDAR